jgi:hypothetical protein
MLRFIALCLFCLPVLAEPLGTPILAFSPMTAADGTKTFRFVGPWKLTLDEAALANALSGEMGKARWCSFGWVETTRQKVSGLLMIEGRCKSAPTGENSQGK